MPSTRSKYQEGSIERAPRSKGPDVWVYRWRQTGADGRRVPRKRVIGTVERYPTQSAARRAVDNLRAEINAADAEAGAVTVREAWGHFQANELRDPEIDRSPTTIALYELNFRVHLLPRWGDTTLEEVRPVEVERWLRGLPSAPSTKSKLRNQMSALFSHAIRHQLYARLNPIATVRQGSKRLRVPDILSIPEIGALLSEITSHAIRVAVLTAAATGLRRSEIRGLQWRDVDCAGGWLRLRRGRVNRHLTKLKTEASRRDMPIPEGLGLALEEWRSQTLYRSESDWVFASESTGGREPIWLDIALKRHVRPAATRAGISKSIGWHTFRRSLATLLATKGESVKVVQELLRDANSSITLQLYQQADPDAKRAAQDHTSALFLVRAS